MLFIQCQRESAGVYRGVVGDCDTCNELFRTKPMPLGDAFDAAERFAEQRTGEGGAYHNIGTDG